MPFFRQKGSIDFGFAIALWLTLGSLAPALELDRGHRVLLEHGLQLQAQVSVASTGYFDTTRWAESNFTTIDTIGLPYEASLMPAPPGLPWATSGIDAQQVEVELEGLPYMSMLRTMGVGGENLPIQVPAHRELFKASINSMHESWPDVITYTNQGPRHNTAEQLRDYMADVQPDMLFSHAYPFGGTLVGGSPADLYGPLEKYRVTALRGNDGTGNQPIPAGFFTQSWVNDNYPPAPGYILSESEIRLNDFALWTFGMKVKTNFIYDWRAPYLLPVLFNGQNTNTPTPLFYQVAETNRQSLNLGPALVRLVSSDLRFITGRHMDGSTPTFNEVPHYIDVDSDPQVFLSSWDVAADPYITDIQATNLGSTNGGLEGDVLVGYFKPLDASFTDFGHDDDTYFMVLNGLSDTNGTPAETNQQIRLEFDFGTSGINSLERMSRNTGLVETVNLVSDGGSQYHLDLTLEGGTADLFKFNNGGTFVSATPVDPPLVLTDDFESYSPGNLVGQPAAIGSGNWLQGDLSIAYGNGALSPVVVNGIGNSGKGIQGQQSSNCCDTSAAFDYGKALPDGARVSIQMDNSTGGGDESWIAVGTDSIANGTAGDELAYAIKSSDYHYSLVYLDGEGNAIQKNFGNLTGQPGDFVEVGLELTVGENGIEGIEGFVQNVTQGGDMIRLAPGDSGTPGTIPMDATGFGLGNTFISTTFFQDFVEDNLTIVTGSGGLIADYNNDGAVDAADYTLWADVVGTQTALANDPTGGTIGLAQYNQWVSNFGLSGSSSAAVPEPTALLLLAGLLPLVGLVRRR